MLPSKRDPEGDQTRSDLDLASADSGQTSDLAHGVDRDAYDDGRETREHTTQARIVTSADRVITARVRDATADERDVSALTRDRAAEARDLEADQRDAEIASLSSFFGTERPTGGQIIMRAARDRQLAASDRARSAMQRVEAGADRDRAASDRVHAGEDRRLAAADRARAQVERKADEVDMLTGARRRGPGDRANNGLIATRDRQARKRHTEA